MNEAIKISGLKKSYGTHIVLNGLDFCVCRAGTARLLFFCRRFLFQTKRKCRNAGSIIV